MTDRREFLKQASALVAFSWPQTSSEVQASSSPEAAPKMKWSFLNGEIGVQIGNEQILKSLSPGYQINGVWRCAEKLSLSQRDLPYSDACGRGFAIVLNCALGQIEGALFLVHYDDGKLGCQLELINKTATPVLLEQCAPLMTCGRNSSIELFGHPAEWRVYIDSGACGGKCASYGLTENEGIHTAGAVSVLWSPEGSQALAIGQMEVERSWTQIVYEYGEKGRNSHTYHWAQTKEVRLRLEQDAVGYRLDPWERFKLDVCGILFHSNPFQVLIAFRDAMTACNRVRKFTNDDVWLGWMTWYNQEAHIRGGFGATGETCASAAATFQQSRFIVDSGLHHYGVRHIEIDDGYQRNLHLGQWLETASNFPEGMKGISDQLKRLGMIPGVWLTPFLATEDSSVYRQHPEWFVCYSFDWYHAGPPVRAYELDPTAPGALEWLLNVFRTFKQWGYWFFKNDFSGGLISSRGKRYYNEKQTGLMRWRWTWQHIKQALGGDTACSIQLCGANNIGAIGIVDSVRTGSDVSPCVGDSQWRTIREDTATTAINRWWQNKHFFICDPDNLEVAEYKNYRLYADKLDLESKLALSFDEARIRAALVVAAGGNIVLGDRLTLLEPERIEIIKKTLPLFGESAVPLDMFEQTIPCLWWHHIAKSWGTWEVLSVVNFGEAGLVKEIPLEHVGLRRDQHVVACELWSEKEHMGLKNGILRVAVKPHSIKTLRLTPIQMDRSLLVGSSFHISMGALEVIDARNSESGTLTIRLERPAPEDGRCAFWSARKQAIVTFPVNCGPGGLELTVD